MIIMEHGGAKCLAKGTWFAWRPVRANYPDYSIRWIWWRTVWWKKFDLPLMIVQSDDFSGIDIEFDHGIKYYVVPTP